MKLFLKSLLFTLTVFGMVAFYAPLLIASGRQVGSIPFLFILGILFMCLGLAAYAWTVYDFAASGRGTPLPVDAPRHLVVRGLYRYTRNPMYLGVLFVILAWAMLFADGWLLLYAMAVFVAVHVFVVFYEEPHLQSLFGSEYEAYRQAVGRWFPGIQVVKKWKIWKGFS
jgi:protein-S-isoprenylcysteine O-methyltransferase Ste14